ncbi:MAG TPA: hypothetical protein VFE57_05815, partial [Cyclobacteriaceae bacterium]|nr:hypothetical protein [Cyclobacteriaceae bacterium]
MQRKRSSSLYKKSRKLLSKGKIVSFLSFNSRTLVALAAAFLLSASIAFATPPTTPYNQNETLDPTCGPTDTNCYVAASSGSSAWSGITGTPTTLSGYGITDAVPYTGATSNLVLGSHNLSANQAGFSGLTQVNSNVAVSGTTQAALTVQAAITSGSGATGQNAGIFSGITTGAGVANTDQVDPLITAMYHQNNGNVNLFKGAEIGGFFLSGTSSITTGYGIDVLGQLATGGTIGTWAGIHIANSNLTNITTPYSIYSETTAPSLWQGAIGLYNLAGNTNGFNNPKISTAADLLNLRGGHLGLSINDNSDVPVATFNTGAANIIGTLTSGNTSPSTTFASSLKATGYNLLTGGSNIGNYGWVDLTANGSFTGNARPVALTNAYNANTFAMLIGSSATTPPTLTTGGALGGSTIVGFSVDKSGNFSIPNGTLTVPRAVLTLNSTPVTSIFGSTTTIQNIAANATDLIFENRTFGGHYLHENWRADGTAASPTALTSGDEIVAYAGGGYNGSSYSAEATGAIQMLATENWNSTSQGTDLVFNVTKNATTALTASVKFDNDLSAQFKGPVGVGIFQNPNIAADPSYDGILTVTGTTNSANRGVIGVYADTNNTSSVVGEYDFGSTYNTSGYKIARTYSQLAGSTANNKGGTWVLQTKQDGGSLTTAISVDQSQNISFPGLSTNGLVKT